MPKTHEQRDTSIPVGNSSDMFLRRKSLWFLKQIRTLKVEADENNFQGLDDSTLAVKLEQLDRLQTQFEETQSQLEREDIAEIEGEARVIFSEAYVSIKANITKVLSSRSISCATSSTRNYSMADELGGHTSSRPNKSSLPALQLPRFNGMVTEWPDFWAMFHVIVGQESTLTNIEKFQHLRSCLSGIALDVLRSLEINDANYEKAVKLLKARFDIKRVQFQAHIKDIFGLDKVPDGSAVCLRELSDKVTSHLRALQTIATNEELLDGLLTHLVISKADIGTQAKWEEEAPTQNLPSWDLVANFLERRVRILESVNTITAAPTKQVTSRKNNRSQSFVTTSAIKNCVFCNATQHTIFTCSQFLNLSPSLRFQEVKKYQLCINCLKKGHVVKNCKSSSCKHCSAKHNTLLHFSQSPQTISQDTGAPPSAKTSLVVEHPEQTFHPSPKGVVMLATAIVMLKSRQGTFIPCRALLDSASQLHCITANMANQLQIKKSKATTHISGIGQSDITSSEYATTLLQSVDRTYSTPISAVVVPTITTYQPEANISNVEWKIPSNISLADPSFFKSQKIDLLIGASLFFELLCVGQIRISKGLPVLQKPRLGWVVSGNLDCSLTKFVHSVAIRECTSDRMDCDLNELVKKFWEVEGHTMENVKRSKEDLACEEHFINNYCRLTSGEYLVSLPFKSSISQLGDSYSQAVRRFQNLEKRFTHNSELKEQYSKFITEYAQLKHMSPVGVIPRGVHTNFLPHHCVIKADSTTTKLRVVFDASAPTSSGFSLNDLLMSGPTIQSRLIDTLLRFRSHKFALTADICKMYRAVKISKSDSFLQCILWRDKPNQEFKIYKLDTVTYGTKPAAFLAIRAMQQLAIEEARNYPLGSEIVLRDFYVDDLISGGASEKQVLQIMTQTEQLLKRGNFILRKWCSNSVNILRKIDPAHREKFLKFGDGIDITKALGLAWDPKRDHFLFLWDPLPEPARATKRNVLSVIARFYDPLGLIGPVVLKAKVFLQSLWKEKLDWDESIPQSLHFAWIQLRANLNFVEKMSFPRFVGLDADNIQIHGFCDASMAAYGACAYVRSQIGGEVRTSLLCSKSRVAPLKTLSIPKLELCAAMLLAELLNSIQTLGPFKGEFFCWSDSTITLSWVSSVAANFNVFVANRISNIQELTQGMSWRHVPTQLNPADILSKGASPKELDAATLWKEGPSYLKEDEAKWPKIRQVDNALLERKKTILILTPKIIDYTIDCKHIHKFRSMRRIYAYVNRFLKIKSNIRWESPQLSLEEIEAGTHLLLRMVQKAAMSLDYNELRAGRAVSSSSNLRSLNPFLDATGLIRVGGRLQNADLSFNARHPIVLPKHHPLTNGIIKYFHQKLLHAGPQALLATIRLQYWPIGGRKSVTAVLNKCLRCFRAKPILMRHIMGNLPAERVRSQRPFYTTGVDFCGPFSYKSEVRNRPPTKCYICVFICFATKATHLELVRDLSTNSFLASLKRFTCLRGQPRVIWSDNATNFVGAKNELKEIRALFLSEQHISEVHKQCLDDGIDWRFIPPRSPHFGGLWEAAVKTAKYHLRRAIGSTVLGFEELRTLVCQITAIVNSRPLCPISESPDDLEVLTPAHFLSGGALTAMAEPNLLSIDCNRLSQWQKTCRIQQSFWKSWSTAYLTQLQERGKWRTKTPNIPPNALVLIQDDNLPPMKWQMGRVIELIKGKDDVVRVAVIKTSTGVTRRAITKLCLLPVEEVENPQGSQRGEHVQGLTHTFT
ncbi:uncharacterized protein LOC129236895 [Anastrepha obliqua]|uniref:uncharacterized protein LOC129236895 n=1 Tax=Anastrepha obliqua TaxID=95512 RepID=UPI002409D48A|nr:uncharacterized protein LOC129236895 [Anastrepha obliqua]